MMASDAEHSSLPFHPYRLRTSKTASSSRHCLRLRQRRQAIAALRSTEPGRDPVRDAALAIVLRDRPLLLAMLRTTSRSSSSSSSSDTLREMETQLDPLRERDSAATDLDAPLSAQAARTSRGVETLPRRRVERPLMRLLAMSGIDVNPPRPPMHEKLPEYNAVWLAVASTTFVVAL